MSETPSHAVARKLRDPTRSKACESCKTRKIRCSGYPPPCSGCRNRAGTCTFGTRKKPLRKNVNKVLMASSPVDFNSLAQAVASQPKLDAPDPSQRDLNDSASTPAGVKQSDLFIDRALFGTQHAESFAQGQPISLKGNGLFSGTYRLSFFSDSRLESLSARLQNNKVNDLVSRISSLIKNRVKSPDDISVSLSTSDGDQKPFIDRSKASRYISIYFARVHPLFPHLDRASVETAISSPHIEQALTDPAFSALYHAVLALGCLHDGGGSFEREKGQAWELFSVSHSLIPELLKSKNPLVALQAITTTAIYSLGISCLAIEQNVMTQAARMAQDLAPTFAKGNSAKSFRRIFWVLYSLEKMSSFHFGRSSVFIDSEIVTALPHIPEANFGSFNWITAFARHSRLLSRAMTSLFCPGNCQKDVDYYTFTIGQLQDDLEEWRLSIPEDYRPRQPCQQYIFRRSVGNPSVIWIHYLYYSFRLILLRTHLQVRGDDPQRNTTCLSTQLRDDLIMVSRSILEIIIFVEVEPSTPLWILAGIPICALFVLFDQVINDPLHPDTKSNLALLDIAGGHFSRIEFASGGSLPGSLIAEFAHIAREYVNETLTKKGSMAQEGGTYFPSRTEMVAPTVVPSNATLPQVTSDAVGNSDADIIPPPLPSTGHESLSFPTSQFVPFQDPWMNESDMMLGIDVMDIFNTFG